MKKNASKKLKTKVTFAIFAKICCPFNFFEQGFK